MSGRLVQIIGGELAVAHYRVSGPGYTLYVADAQSAHGWEYYADAVESEDFAAPWHQPAGAQDAYALGAIVSHGGARWRSTIVANVWEPGVSGWVDAGAETPAWVQPSGAHDAYSEGAVVTHGGKFWRSLLDANVWAPGVSGWREAALLPPTGTPAVPAWVQPSGANDAYQFGDRVTHNGQTWTSTAPNNVWEPGVYGWTAD